MPDRDDQQGPTDLSRRRMLGSAGAIAVGGLLGAVAGALPAVAAPAGGVVPAGQPSGAGSAAAPTLADLLSARELICVGPADFRAADGGVTVIDADGVGSPSPSGAIVAPVQALRNGATKIDAIFTVSTAGQPVTVSIRQRGTSGLTVLSTATVPGSPGFYLVYVPEIAGPIDLLQGPVFVRVDFSASGQRVVAVNLYHDRQIGGIRLVPQSRVLDTRSGGGGQLLSGQTRQLALTSAGVPGGATAALVNLTVVDTVGAGFLALYPGGTPQPGTSTVNWSGPGQILATSAIVALGLGSALALSAGGGGRTHAVLDVSGYVVGGAAT